MSEDLEPDFSVGQGDNNVPWNDVITDIDGNPVDITGKTISLRLAIDDGSAAPVTNAAVNVTPAAGAVQYMFLSADTVNDGIYKANWIVTDGAGGQVTYPVDRPHKIVEIRGPV